jgi:hypothetical protein
VGTVKYKVKEENIVKLQKYLQLKKEKDGKPNRVGTSSKQ